MGNTHYTRLIRFCAAVSKAAGVFLIVLGGAVLVGWKLDILILKSVLPGMVTMKANTAGAFLVSGVSLVGFNCLPEIHRPQATVFVRRMSELGAAVVALLGLLTLMEYLGGVDLGIDQLLFREAATAVLTSNPGRMAPVTALNFLMLGMSLLLSGSERRRHQRISLFLALAAGISALLAFVGYAYGIQKLYSVAQYTAMALHTALTFIVASVGIALLRSERLLRRNDSVVREMQVYIVTIAFMVGILFVGAYEKARWDIERQREGNDHSIMQIIHKLGRVMLLDETLTMSAKMAAASGDHAYQKRYENAEKELETLIAEMHDQFPGSYAVRHIDAADTANQWLVAQEHRALELAAKGRRSEALALLNGKEYADYKGIYSGRVHDALASVEDEHLEYLGRVRRFGLFFIGAGIFGSVLIFFGWYFSIRSVADRRRAEAELIRTVGQLKKSNEELARFATLSSHDLQEPLRKITSFAEVLAQRYQGRLDADADRYIGYIVEGAQRMRTQIRDLRAYSLLDSSEKDFVEIDLNTVVRKTLAEMDAAVTESGAAITCDPLPTVRANAVQMGVVFQNLIGNALKFKSSEPLKVHIGASSEKNAWILSVRDTGIGIEPQHFARVFQLFQRLHTREEYLGTGIGLALCKKIVERHGGKIWFESVPGKGATFFFTVPCTLGKADERQST